MSEVSRNPTAADLIRTFLVRRYVQPAQARGDREVAIRAGDVHREIGLDNRMPAVCSVLDGRIFREANGLELIERSGPPQGANAVFRFRLPDAASDANSTETAGMSASRFAAALAYAALVHARQRRKGTNIPYISHLMSVSALVMEFGGDEDQAIAGLLHDVLEDCGAWHEAVIRAEFGGRVAEIVVACTDGVPDASGAKPPWRERKQRYLAHLEDASDDVLLVSACDKLHNARAIAADLAAGHDVFARFKAGREGTLWYYAGHLRIFTARMEATHPLVRELHSAVARMEQR
jgi:GTP pyrophosphokinase